MVSLSGRNWVIDGGVGYALEDSGFGVDQDPLWSARLLSTNPDAIKQVHRSYLESGAEIVITSSYQASVQGFHNHLGVKQDKAIQLMENSVHLAREAVQDYCSQQHGKVSQPLIAGSIGPYGACQADGSEYNGKYVSDMSNEELIEWHRPRMSALVKAGVDILAIETIPSLKEMLAIITLLHTFPNTKAWVSFSCKDGLHTNYGDDFGKATLQCYKEGGDQIIAVGINCTSPEHIASLLEHANLHLPSPSILPRVVYSNAGDRWIPGQGWENRGKDWSYISLVETWLSLGASVVGGCCGLGPKDIKSIAQIVSSTPFKNR